MILIKLDDLKKWRADRIASGRCNYDDMVALGAFIDRAERCEVQDDYFDDNTNDGTIPAVDVPDKRR